jgi:tRNA(ile)-lysidine synthase
MEKGLQARFREHISEHFPQLKSGGGVFLLAFSGGADSTVLGELLFAEGVRFAAAHCNFHLRGDESDRDAAFACRMAGKWGCVFHQTDFDTVKYAASKGISIEMAARELRYGWFGKLVEEYGYGGVLTAHHGDDQVETILLNFTRGTSLDGLLGMAPKAGNILRPMLPFSRAEIERFAVGNGLEWVDDSTNASTDYTRNRIRHNVMPELKNINPSIVGSVARNTEYLRLVAAFYHSSVDRAAGDIVSADGKCARLDIKALEELGGHARIVLYEVLKRFSMEDRTDDILRSIGSQSGKVFLSATHRMLRDRDFFIVEPLGQETDKAGAVTVETFSCRKEVLAPVHMVLCCQEVKKGMVLPDGVREACFDAGKVSFPLVLRLWKEGDHIRPFGMGGASKKVSKCLKDAKMPVFEKERTFVLCNGDGRVMWIAGLRCSQDFAVTDATRRVIRVSMVE